MAQDRRLDRHRNRRTSTAAARKPFVGVDGEGGNFDTGHEYMLLRAGNHVHETGRPLTHHTLIPWIADLPKDVIYVSFFFDYDVTMILRKLPPERVKRLLDIDCRRVPDKPCSSFPIELGRSFQIDYLPRKEFRVRRIGQPWTIISDVGTFFQSSFVSALEKWFPEDKWAAVIEKIRQGKQQRNEFGAVTQEEREYNHLEILMLEQLMERFRDMCDGLDIRPNRWQGPGNLVSAVFKREGLPLNKTIPLFERDKDVARFANSAYYGGRFEVARFGEIVGPVYQYDINSAYAAVYGRLPCLLHSTWRRITQLPSDRQLYVANVQFSHAEKFRFCTLPVRTKNGTLVFPRQGSGTYWSTELDVARSHGVQMDFQDGYVLEQHCECKSFHFVDDMYHERKRLGKDGKGMVLKIILASTYGKLAQSVGCAPYSNPVWAGLIVSSVRAQLISAALSLSDGGTGVCMLATDGLFTTTPLPSLPIGSKLGEWELTEHADIFIVQSGVYFLPDKRPKTRGVPQSRIIDHESDFRGTWQHFMDGGDLRPVSVQLHNFVGLRLAHARNKPGIAGQWVNVIKDISFDWTSKRANARQLGHSMVTDPPEGSRELVSVEYNRVIGGINATSRLETDDQPDWSDQL